MAETEPEAPAPAVYDPEATYDVRLTRPVQVGSMVLRPLHGHRLKGRIVAQLIESYGEGVFDRVDPAS